MPRGAGLDVQVLENQELRYEPPVGTVGDMNKNFKSGYRTFGKIDKAGYGL